MYYYCTYFDSNFLVQGLTLYQSLLDHCEEFKLWVLCLDQACFEVLNSADFEHLVAISLRELEDFDVQLAASKGNRSVIEYYFTCTAAFTYFVMKQNPEVDLITYLDADLYFFADPEPIYRELDGHSVGVIGHRFPDNMRKLERYGIYNVAWVSFRRDKDAMACLESWRSQCIDWCYDRLEGERFADQKYLDRWPEKFINVRVIQHKGANLAPWNVARFNITADSAVTVDTQPLLFYHFHGLKKVKYLPILDTSLGASRAVLGRSLRKEVYRPYLLAMAATRQRLADMGVDTTSGASVREFVNNLWSSSTLKSLSKIFLIVYSVVICRAYMYHAGD